MTAVLTRAERLTLADALMALWLWAEHPQPALTDVPYGALPHPAGRWHYHFVTGPWLAVQDEMARGLIDAAIAGWEPDGFAVLETSEPGEVFIANTQRDQWARVRVTVEVLDGIP